MEILTQKGFSATGLDEILRSISVPKGSFYHYFESKEGYGAELIDTYAAYFARKLDRFFLDETRRPLVRIRDFVQDAKAGMARYNYTRGCLIGNLGQEMGALPEDFRERLSNVFADWEARLEKCLLAAKALGEIPASVDCGRLAKFFWIGWEGAVLRAKLECNASSLDLFSESFFSLVSRTRQFRSVPDGRHFPYRWCGSVRQ
jgi:TetR/AcrR family transcriptional repressor of nem operon